MGAIANALSGLYPSGFPVRLSAYDGSSAGGLDSPYEVRIENERGLSYIVTAPGTLGLARAYVAGDLSISGVHPGDPYPALAALANASGFERPSAGGVVDLIRSLGLKRFAPPPPPPQEHLPPWRAGLEVLRGKVADLRPERRHSRMRDAEAIHHHYDVSNAFYEHVLGPSMTYTCAYYADEANTLEQAQEDKYELICRKLDLQPGQRLLDLGCGWGGMVRHAAKHHGVKALGVTLSRQQASWAQEEIKRQGLDEVAEVRFSDYRDVAETGFDAISSIGLTEHIGVRNYASYFGFIRDRLRAQGRLLNHCITRPGNRLRAKAGAFIDRYVFPDGELIGSGTIAAAVEDAGLEIQHHENFRPHYAKTLAAWNRNLVEHWDACVAEVGLATAKVWGLYMAGSRMGFERNWIQLHQVLATKTVEGVSDYPLRHAF